jgi:hypothetical protein
VQSIGLVLASVLLDCHFHFSVKAMPLVSHSNFDPFYTIFEFSQSFHIGHWVTCFRNRCAVGAQN